MRKRNLFQNNGVQRRRRRIFSCFIPTLQSSPLFHVKDSSIRWAGIKHHSQDIKTKSLSKSSMSLKTSTSAQYSSSASAAAADDDGEENTIRRFQFCPDCHGMGKKPSRKHRSKKKRLKNNNVQLLEKCSTCDGTGLVSSSSPSAVQDCNKDYHVSIIGGGIGGMALALALQHRQIPCTIYEKDTHFDERLQGYGLTIQQGNTALTSLGIHQLEGGIYSKRHVVHATNGTILGQWGHRVWVGGDKEHSKNQSKKQRQNVHIARQKLREILYKQLLVHSSSSDLIQWGHKFLQYNKNDMDGNIMEMTFLVDGEMKKEKTSIIVGADGIFSNVRKQKFTSPETKMNYLGCIVILGICSTPSKYLDDETVFQTADGTTRLYAMPFSPNSINEFLPPSNNSTTTINNSISNDATTTTMWQLSFPMEEEEAIRLSQTRESLHNEALKRCQSWHEPIPTILKSTPTDLVSGYPVYDRNIPENDYFRKGDDDSSTTVTFIGDAAHPMSPFKVRTHIIFIPTIFVIHIKSV